MRCGKKWIGLALSIILFSQSIIYANAEDELTYKSSSQTDEETDVNITAQSDSTPLDIQIGQKIKVKVPYYENTYEVINGIEPVEYKSNSPDVAFAYYTGITLGGAEKYLEVEIMAKSIGNANITINMKKSGLSLASYSVTVNPPEEEALLLCTDQKTEFTLEYATKDFSYDFSTPDINRTLHGQSTSSFQIGNNYSSKTVMEMSFRTLGTYSIYFYDGNKQLIKKISLNIVDHSWDDGVISQPPSCTESGTRVYTCHTCKITKKDSAGLTTLGHEFSNDWTTNKEPSCTETGSKSRHCTRIGCDTRTDETELSMLKHTYSQEWAIDKEPSCTEAGSKSHHCLQCGTKADITVIPALGHKLSDKWTIDKNVSCTEAGSKSHHCLQCDAKNDVTKIPALGHEFSNDKVKVYRHATCFEPGLTAQVCKRCDAESDKIVTPKLEHNIVSYEWYRNGTHVSYCSLCTSLLGENCTYSGGHCKFCHGDLIQPTIRLAPYQWTYTGTESPVKMGYVESNSIEHISNDEITYTCYIDSNLKQKTTPSNSGAASPGQAPVKVGTYYVKASIDAKGIHKAATATAKFDIIPRIPGLHSLSSVHSGIQMYFTIPKEAEGCYIFRKTSGSGDWLCIKTFKNNQANSYMDDTVEPGLTYSYRLTAYCGDMMSNLDEKGLSAQYQLLKSPFSDVNETSWYYDSVKYVYSLRIMTGLDVDRFGGAQEVSRAQFATILYRMDGEKNIPYRTLFPDVSKGQFYSIPATWAYDTKVISGYANGCFGPADMMTREQLVTMMYRYAQYKGYRTDQSGNLNAFPDVNSVSPFARTAMDWAVGSGLISGDQGKLNPRGVTSRAVTATIIKRFLKAN